VLRTATQSFAFVLLTSQQNAKSTAAAPETQKVPEPIFWVKCDECDRWRIINGLTHEEQTKLMKKSWNCKMHPDASQRECDKVVSRFRGLGVHSARLNRVVTGEASLEEVDGLFGSCQLHTSATALLSAASTQSRRCGLTAVFWLASCALALI
jgi:hypothetical protein